MKAIEFVEQIKLLKPSIEALGGLNATENLKIELLKSYDVSAKAADITSNSEIVKLISEYDLRELEIGSITFNNNVLNSGNYLIIGKDEADILALDLSDNKIKLLDHEDESEVLIECAENGESFLDALYVVKDFYTNNLLDQKSYNNQDTKCSIAFRCASLAGGKNYLDYYKNVLECFN